MLKRLQPMSAPANRLSNLGKFKFRHAVPLLLEAVEGFFFLQRLVEQAAKRRVAHCQLFSSFEVSLELLEHLGVKDMAFNECSGYCHRRANGWFAARWRALRPLLPPYSRGPRTTDA